MTRVAAMVAAVRLARITASLGCVFVLFAFATRAFAADGCVRPCKADTAHCVAQRCPGLHGEARRTCRETCRGIGGCANIGTLAWVDTVCRTDANGTSIHQTLRVRRGNCAPVTVMDLPQGPPLPDLLLDLGVGGSCKVYGEIAASVVSVLAAPFQRLMVSPDGRSVVFEVTSDRDTTWLPSFSPVGPGQDGMWYVRSDGTGLRRLGPASRYPRWQVNPSPGGPLLGAFVVFVNSEASFSPSSRKLAFSDLGPGTTGEEAPQVWVLDLDSGSRQQVTHLPKPYLPDGYSGSYGFSISSFVNDETVVFWRRTREGGGSLFTVNTSGGEPEALPLPAALPSGDIDPTLAVISSRLMTSAVLQHSDGSLDLFLFRPDGRLLQLTNLHTHDLRSEDPSPNQRRFLFITPEDPLGTNPSHNCQIFSVNDFATGLRQLTHFSETDQATSGCNFTLPRSGCAISTTFWDPVTSEIVFYSTCDPFGTNPSGGQLFAMRPDGSHLRQLTASRGLTIDADGTVTADLPGPFRYSGAGAN